MNLLQAVLGLTSVYAVAAKAVDTKAKDDEKYWSRVLQDDGMSFTSQPTPLPTLPPTSVPTVSPPTLQPTTPPTPPPTSIPTLTPPISQPTSSPTPSPTIIPTLSPPISQPTSPPTLSTAPPTAAPTVVCCDTQVIVDCETTEDAVPCEDIVQTAGVCTQTGLNQPMDVLKFYYEPNDCSSATNSQQDDGTYTCTDGPGDRNVCSDAASVMVTCKGPTGTTIFEGPVSNTGDMYADTFTVGTSGTTLPASLECQIKSVDSGTVCQTVKFDTSGTIDVFLTDQYGDLTLHACENDSGEYDDCFLDVTFDYDFMNLGEFEVLITSWNRTFTPPGSPEGDKDLLPQLSEEERLVAGKESFVFSESRMITICEDIEWSVITRVEVIPSGSGDTAAVADTGGGFRRRLNQNTGQSSSTYSFEIKP